MKIHRFFVKDFDKVKPEIASNKANQIIKVLRLKRGEMLQVFDNSGFEYDAEILDFKKDLVELNIKEKREKIIPKNNIEVYASIIKKDNFEWVVQKLTEIGVAKIVPVIAERSEKKNINMERLLKIAEEASEQSGRTIMPEIGDIFTLESVIENNGSFAVFDSSGLNFSNSNSQTLPQNILIGPEGGWSEKEMKIFKEKNIPIYSLGETILRAETASVVAVSKIIV